MSTQDVVIPVIDLYEARRRRDLIEYFLDQNDGEWLTKQDILNDIDGLVSDTLEDHLGVYADYSKEQWDGPLYRYGIVDVKGKGTNYPRYRRGDSNVVRALLSWRHEEGGYPITELLGSKAKQKLVSFYLEQADPDEQYTRSELAEETTANYSTIADHIGVLVEARLVEKIGEGYGEGYQFNGEAPIVEFLRTLNDLLLEAYRERSN